MAFAAKVNCTVHTTPLLEAFGCAEPPSLTSLITEIFEFIMHLTTRKPISHEPVQQHPLAAYVWRLLGVGKV